MFEYYRKKMQAAAGKDNKIVKALLCLTGYCLHCLERFVKFISKMAYIQVALTSHNFCKSAMNAFLLIIKNALRFGVASGVGCIFMFLGKLFVMISSCLICYLMLTEWEKPADVVQTPYGTCLVVIIVAYLISSIFMSVFSFASDAIFQSFILDEELGPEGRPPQNRPPVMNSFISKA